MRRGKHLPAWAGPQSVHESVQGVLAEKAVSVGMVGIAANARSAEGAVSVSMDGSAIGARSAVGGGRGRHLPAWAAAP